MKKGLIVTCVLLGLAASAVRAQSESASSLGLGVRMHRTLDSLPHRYTKTGFGPSINWRTHLTDLVSVQVELNAYEDGYAGSPQDVASPQLFLLLGHELYAGVGAGLLYSNDKFSHPPFVALRAGYLMSLRDRLSLDINLSYEFAEWKGVNEFDKSVDSDALVLGAGLRIAL